MSCVTGSSEPNLSIQAAEPSGKKNLSTEGSLFPPIGKLHLVRVEAKLDAAGLAVPVFSHVHVHDAGVVAVLVVVGDGTTKVPGASSCCCFFVRSPDYTLAIGLNAELEVIPSLL